MHATRAVPRSWAIVFLETRKVVWSVEQPRGSILYCVQAVKVVMEVTSANRWITWLGAFGCKSPKPIEMYSTLPEADMYLVRNQKSANSRAGKRAGVKKRPAALLTKQTAKTSSSSGSDSWRPNVWITGNKKKMKQSQEYPYESAAKIADLAMANFKWATGKMKTAPRRDPKLRGLVA